MHSNTQFRRAHASVDNPTTNRSRYPCADLMAFFRQQRRDLEAFRDEQRTALKAFRTATAGQDDVSSLVQTPPRGLPWKVETADGAAPAPVPSDDSGQSHCGGDAQRSKQAAAASPIDRGRTQADETCAFAQSKVFNVRRTQPARPGRNGRCVLEFLRWKAPTGEALQILSLQAMKVRWDRAAEAWVSDALAELHGAGLLHAVSSVVAENGVLTLRIPRDVKYLDPWTGDRLRARSLMGSQFPSIKLYCQAGDPVGECASRDEQVCWTRVWIPARP